MADPALATLQRWMAHLVQHRRNATAAARSRRAHELVPTGRAMNGSVVRPSATMAPMQRVDVYNSAYIARLVEALRSDFPGLVHAVGNDAFFEIGRGYVESHPSTHSNLIFLCTRLPDYIGRRKHLQHRAFLRDLAILEVAMTQAFHAPAFEILDVSALGHLTPDEWNGVQLVTNPSLRLVKANYPIDHYLQDVFDKKDPTIPARRTSYVAVYRKSYQVWRSRLTRRAFDTLSALQRGELFGDALARAGEEAGRVGIWFQDWTSDGLFERAVVPPESAV
jgi:hypothetical protein